MIPADDEADEGEEGLEAPATSSGVRAPLGTPMAGSKLRPQAATKEAALADP